MKSIPSPVVRPQPKHPAPKVPVALAAAAAAVLGAQPAAAIDVIDDFDGSFLDADVWEQIGDKTATLAGGSLTWENDGGDWADGEIASRRAFFLPPPGETTTITWVLGPASISSDNGGDPAASSLRYQIGIFSANQGPGRVEMWNNTTGGTWIDLTNISSISPDTVGGNLFHANDTKADSSQGTDLGAVSISGWPWQTESRTFRLEITGEGYTWFDGDTALGSLTWADAGIDTEFANGYRVATIGMNYAGGRGSLGVDRVAVVNGGEPSVLLQGFGASRGRLWAGQRGLLTWQIDPSATASIDQGLGDVTPLTRSDGTGEVAFIAAEVVDVPTQVSYSLTAIRGAEQESRPAVVTVLPRPVLATGGFEDEFDGPGIDPAAWETRGPKAFSVANGYLNWDAATGGDWGHHEISSLATYPLPGPGATTTVTWVLGPGEVTLDNAGDTSAPSIRYQLGLFSYHETHEWSRQTWQNSTGGVWIDLYFNRDNPGSATGGVIFANDEKPVDSQYEWLTSVNVPDWEWQTDDHEFRIVMDSYGYTWFSGQDVIYTGTWNGAGIDNEFTNGFRILAAGMNYSVGRGSTSLQRVAVEHAAVSGGEPFAALGVALEAGAATVTWESGAGGGATYDVERNSSLLPPWEMIAEALPGTGAATSFLDPAPPAGQAYYRVRRAGGGAPAPFFEVGFEPGEDLSGWIESVVTGSPQWQAGAPTSGPRAAYSGTGVYATQLDGPYGDNQTVFLRSPLIDLGGRRGVTLEFYHWFEFESDVALPLDLGELMVYGADGFPVLTSPFRVTGQSGGWYLGSVVIPPDAGDEIQLEFGLFTDGLNGLSGWFIDDLSIR